ncbi:cell wall hydrolase [Sphingomonas jatrophae]|uniref:Cell Wall Hydrolase n=1 Tax=Sphingomonas jatrophae TaxID=1166337 RepID=A0A1I6L0I2_9SPHN|nr:cell wall hydrolase [Sphingomonas jatrophae]SFR96961.1 Cell Wall Hydrolase [Sphingomonas jatrophae]
MLGSALGLLAATYVLSGLRETPPGTPIVRTHAATRASPRVRLAEPPPMVEPLELLEMTPERAREINAAVPFIPGPISPARPFRFAGSDADRERAALCLTSAALYEAGDDPVGQRAVVQVVLNRLRHPAYPKTICGVVFQGSERKTGCQFTFTCDGALARRPLMPMWDRARKIAEAALDGAVAKVVGTATHYHTDWVVPYWSASLDKIAAVHTHLFFRWRGGWGLNGAFTGRYAGGEVLDRRLREFATPGTLDEVESEPLVDGEPVPAEPVPARAALQVAGVEPRALRGSIVRLADEQAGEFGLQLDPAAFSGDFALTALALCARRPACLVAGWAEPRLIPAKLPIPRQSLQTVSFLYRKVAGSDREQVLWNCRHTPRPSPAQCLPGTAPVAPAGPARLSPEVKAPTATGEAASMEVR